LSSAAKALTKSTSGNSQQKGNTRTEGNNVVKKGVVDHLHDHPVPHSSAAKSNPSGHPPQQQQAAKHLASKSIPVASAPPAPTSILTSHVPRQTSEEPDTATVGPGRETGAIMKQKMKPRQTKCNQNHLDEILALPLDDQS
jgi:hypothetical protein